MSTNKAPRNAFQRILRGVLVGANLGTILLLWMSVLSTYLPPDLFPRLSLAGLAFPVFLVANILFVFLWLIFRARLVWLPLLGMIVVGNFILDYCPMNGKGQMTDSSLCVLSLNAGGVSSKEERDSFWAYIDKMNPDIVCLQEISPTWFGTDEAQADMKRIGYKHMGVKGTYVLSRLPMHEADIQFDYKTKGNGSYACWVISNQDSLLVISNHLESNRLSSEDKDEYRQIIHNPNRDKVENEGRALAGKLAGAAQLRGPQVDSLCAVVHQYAGTPILLCGDFNDTPISYTYQQLSRCLTSAFRQSGRGMGFSFNQDEFFVHIDHIFFSSHFESTYTFIDREMCISDHYPIVTYVHLKGR